MHSPRISSNKISPSENISELSGEHPGSTPRIFSIDQYSIFCLVEVGGAKASILI
jgi:hypothetical protein